MKLRKSMLLSLATILLSSIFPLHTFAASYSVYLSGGGTFTDSVYVYLTVSGSTTMGGACGGICGVSGVLNYDSAKLEMTAASGLQGFDYLQGTSFVISKSTAANDGGITSWRFRNIGLASGESTTISVSNITVTNGDIEENFGVSSVNVRYETPQVAPVAEPTNEEPATLTVPNTADDSDRTTNGNANTEPTTSKDTNSENATNSQTTTKKSSNASLSKITLSAGILEFDKNLLSYDVIVDADVSNISINAKSESNKAKINGTGTFEVKYGANEFKLTVTAEDGTQKEYVIKVYRDGTEAAISQSNSIIAGLIIAIIVLCIAVIALSSILIISKKKTPKNNTPSDDTPKNDTPKDDTAKDDDDIPISSETFTSPN